MATTHGNDGAVYSGATQIASVVSFTLERGVQTASGNAMGDSAEKNINGIETYSGTVECLYDPADAGQITLTDGAQVSLVFYPSGNSAGLPEITVPALIETNSITTSMDDMVKATFSFKPDSSGTGITDATV